MTRQVAKSAIGAATGIAMVAGLALADGQAHMSEDISYLLVMTVNEGQQAEVEPLLKEMVASTATEPGALNYEFHLAGDKVHSYERFTDSDAVLAHFTTFGEKFAVRFLGIFAVESMTLYGPADDRVREAAAGFGAVPMVHIAGFKR